MKTVNMRICIREVPGDTHTPVTLYSAYVGKGPGFLLESRQEGKGRYTFLGRMDGSLETLDGKSVLTEGTQTRILPEDPFHAVARVLERYRLQEPAPFPFAGGLVGYLGYDAVRHRETLPDTSPEETGLPLARFMVSTRYLTMDHLHQRVYLVALVEEQDSFHERGEAELDRMEKDLRDGMAASAGAVPESRVTRLEANMGREEFMEKVERVRSHIIRGDVFQTVLSLRYRAKTGTDPFRVYRNLRQINPSPYLFFLDFGDSQVMGSSPEMLAEKRGSRLSTCPIAGTRPRGSAPEEDIRLAEELLQDEKETAEHMMLVDLSRNDMGRVSRPGTVTVPQLKEVHRFSHVMHLVSLVEGEALPELSAPEILASFLPAGTLSGAPKIRAMELIEELEPVKRGFYGGCAGYFGFDGDMDTCIAIRCLAMKDGTAFLQAGAGIVYDSDPAREYQEVRNKLQATLKALGPVEVPPQGH